MLKFLNTILFLIFVFARAEATYIRDFYPEIEETLLNSFPKKHKGAMSDLQIDRLHIIIGEEQSGKNTLARLLSNSRLTINENLTLDVQKEEKLKQEKEDSYNFPNFYHYEGQHFLNLSSSSFNTIEDMFLAAEVIDRAKHKNIFITVSQDEMKQKSYASLEKHFSLLKNAIEKKGSFLDRLMIGSAIPIVTKSDCNSDEVKEYLVKGFSQKIGDVLGNHLSKKMEQGNFGLLPNPQNKERGKNYNDVYQKHIKNIFQISEKNISDQKLLGDYIKQKGVDHVAFGLLPNNQLQDRQENYRGQLEKYQAAIKLQEQITHNNRYIKADDEYEYRQYEQLQYQKLETLLFGMEKLEQAYQKYRSDNEELIQKYKKELHEKDLYRDLMNDQNYKKQLKKMFFSEKDHAEIYEEHIKKILSNTYNELLNDGRYGTDVLKSFYTTFYQDQKIKEQLFKFSQNAASIMTRDIEKYFHRFMQSSRTRMLEEARRTPSFASISYNNFMSRNDLGDFSNKESSFLQSLNHQYGYEIKEKLYKQRQKGEIFLDNLRLNVDSIVFDFSMIRDGILSHPSARSLINFMSSLDKHEHITGSFKEILERKYYDDFKNQSYEYMHEIEYLYYDQMKRAEIESKRIQQSISIKSITQDGGTIKNNFIQAVVPESAVDNPKVFGTIVKDDEVTPLGSKIKIFGFRPHQEFNRYIEITQKEVLNQSNIKLCFIKQSPEQEIFDLWGIWPVSDNIYNR